MKDVLGWKSIRGAVLSNNGRWFAYRLAPNEGNAELVLRQTKGRKELRFPVGSSRRGGEMVFSHDSKWFAFRVYPLKKRGGSSSRTRSSTAKLVLLEVGAGKKTAFEKVRRFAFSGESARWVALHKSPAGAATSSPSSTTSARTRRRTRGSAPSSSSST
ncbi:MAG: hypothetical protein ACE5KM_24890, partial [Planctomycetaceae bacterium]